MANISDVAITRGRALLGEATKPLYAWIGAGDLVVSQAAALPARAQDRLKGLRETSPASVRSAVEGYGALARNGFTELARRGERVVGTVRNRPSTESDSESPIDAEKVARPPVARATKAAPRATAARRSAPRKTASRTKTQ